MTKTRTRFAPSPTGFIHLGNIRSALYPWAFARAQQGTFILRIEDTDKERNSEEYLRLIYDSLNWLGLNWDEGPRYGKNGGGDFGPYRQSERSDIYRQYVQRLMDAGRAYEKDGAVWFKLLGERHKVFDEHRKKEVEKVKNAPSVIDDQIRGRVERTEDEDFVIVRSDGQPVFHFVNVVDDLEMGITHVIRGEEWLPSAPLHVLLYKYLGWESSMPQFAHRAHQHLETLFVLDATPRHHQRLALDASTRGTLSAPALHVDSVGNQMHLVVAVSRARHRVDTGCRRSHLRRPAHSHGRVGVARTLIAQGLPHQGHASGIGKQAQEGAPPIGGEHRHLPRQQGHRRLGRDHQRASGALRGPQQPRQGGRDVLGGKFFILRNRRLQQRG